MTELNERTFDLPGVGRRAYRFPTQFHDVEVLGAVAAVDHASAAAWLPAPLRPRRLPGRRALLLLTVQRFARPAEFPGYEEASIAVMSTAGRGRGFHVLTMPVTSAENLARGPTIFGLPKEKADVTLAQDGRTHVGAVSVGGERLFTLRFRPRLTFPVRVPVRSRYLQLHEGAPAHVDSRGRGNMQVGSADIEVTPLLKARYTGLPERLAVFAAFRVFNGALALHLPRRV